MVIWGMGGAGDRRQGLQRSRKKPCEGGDMFTVLVVVMVSQIIMSKLIKL